MKIRTTTKFLFCSRFPLWSILSTRCPWIGTEPAVVHRGLHASGISGAGRFPWSGFDPEPCGEGDPICRTAVNWGLLNLCGSWTRGAAAFLHVEIQCLHDRTDAQPCHVLPGHSPEQSVSQLEDWLHDASERASNAGSAPPHGDQLAALLTQEYRSLVRYCIVVLGCSPLPSAAEKMHGSAPKYKLVKIDRTYIPAFF